MPYSVTWYEDNEPILVMTLSGKWTLAEWLQAADTAYQMVRDTAQPAQLLITYQCPEGYMPPGMLHGLHVIAEHAIIQDPHILAITCTADNRLLKLMGRIFQRMYKVKKLRHIAVAVAAVD